MDRQKNTFSVLEKISIAAKYLFSIAIIYFSTSLLIFVNELSETRKAIPLLIEKLESIENSENIMAALKLAADITSNTAKVAEEIGEVRKDLPQLYSEVDKTRKIIPDILAEAKALRGTLPSIYSDMDKTRAIIPGVLTEVEKARAMMPEIVGEIEAVRKDAPRIIADTDKLLEKAQQISDKAGKGAVHGAVKGIITAPINVIESGFSNVKEAVTGRDRKE